MQYKTHDPLEEHGFIHKYVTNLQKDYANRTVLVNNCEGRGNPYQLWMKKFMDVNKYNHEYIQSIPVIHNKRAKTKKEMFLEILYYKEQKNSEIRSK